MDEAKSYLLDILQGSRARLSNPFVFAFVISWLLWNFRFVLILVGDGGWKDKIDYIDSQIVGDTYTWLLNGLFLPCLSAVVWIYALPPVFRTISTHHEKQKNSSNEALLQVSGARAISEGEAVKIRSTILSQRKKWADEKSDIVKSLEDITTSNIDLLRSNSELQSQILKDSNNFSMELAKKDALFAKSKAEFDRQLESKDNEIRELKKPPQPAYEKLNSQEKAKAIGLRIRDNKTSNSSLVTFENLQVAWPWKLNEFANARVGFQVTARGHIVTEEMVAAMLAIPLALNKWPESAVVELLSIANVPNPGQSLTLVRELNIFSFVGGELALGNGGLSILRKIRELGFQVPPKQTLRTAASLP